MSGGAKRPKRRKMSFSEVGWDSYFTTRQIVEVQRMMSVLVLTIINSFWGLHYYIITSLIHYNIINLTLLILHY